MQLFQNGSPNTPTFPAKQALVGSPGYANSGPPGVVASTRLDPDVVNTILAEFWNVSVAAGIPFDPTDNGQLLKWLNRLFGSGSQTYQTPGTYTFVVPAGVTRILVQVWGGGGGGGSATVAGASGSGGCGGGYCEKICTVTPGASITITVGARGVGSTGAFNGTAGGTSSVGSFCSATGGDGGFYSSGGGQTVVGSSGAGIGGDLNLGGQGAGTGETIGSQGLGGNGGGAFGAPSSYQGLSGGGSGTGPGGAGGGGANVGAGGDGSFGLVIIRW
jgi:hypothetical protein